MNKKLDKRYKEIKELQEEIMRFEIDKGYIKIKEYSVQEYKNGKKTFKILSRDQVIKYILMPIRDVEKTIPFDFSDYNNISLGEDESQYNKLFHKYIDRIHNIYREKAIEHMQIVEGDRLLKTSKIAIYVAILGVAVGLTTIAVSVF